MANTIVKIKIYVEEEVWRPGLNLGTHVKSPLSQTTRPVMLITWMY
jgi:hypothetical protein